MTFDCLYLIFSAFTILDTYDLTDYLVQLHKEMTLLDRLSPFDKPQEYTMQKIKEIMPNNPSYVSTTAGKKNFTLFFFS